MESVLLDVAGHRRSPATMPGPRRGRPRRHKGEQYPADPPTVEEIVAVMRTIGGRADRPPTPRTLARHARGRRPPPVSKGMFDEESVARRLLDGSVAGAGSVQIGLPQTPVRADLVKRPIGVWATYGWGAAPKRHIRHAITVLSLRKTQIAGITIFRTRGAFSKFESARTAGARRLPAYL